MSAILFFFLSTFLLYLLYTKAPAIGEQQGSTLLRSYTVSNLLENSSVLSVQLPGQTGESSGVLASGSTTIIPMWIRGDRIGKHDFRFMFGYQSEVRNHNFFFFYILFIIGEHK